MRVDYYLPGEEKLGQREMGRDMSKAATSQLDSRNDSGVLLYSRMTIVSNNESLLLLEERTFNVLITKK